MSKYGRPIGEPYLMALSNWVKILVWLATPLTMLPQVSWSLGSGSGCFVSDT